MNSCFKLYITARNLTTGCILLTVQHLADSLLSADITRYCLEQPAATYSYRHIMFMRRKIKCDACIALRAGPDCRMDSLHPPTYTVVASVFREAIKGTLHYTADISGTDSAEVGHTL